MMYFDAPTQASLARRFHRCLRRGGYLFAAPRECMKGIAHPFRSISQTVFQKT
jgi:chemotaxis protein methyltransferase CheR